MKRQKETIGSIVEIDLKNGYYAYAQILDGGYAFFDYTADKQLQDFSVLLSVKALFILAIYKDVVTQRRWIKVGKLSIREDFKVLPMKFIQDTLEPEKFSLYNPNTGEITPASKEKCKGLEQAAVWEAWEVEERLSDYFENKPDKTQAEYDKIFS